MDMNDLAISRAEINQTLSKIRSLSTQAKALNIAPGSLNPIEKPQFNSLMAIAKDAVTNVNSNQLHADAIKGAYIQGDPNVSISQVMVASVKSKVAFEGLTAVRNKMIDFYKEIMNMPI